MRVTDLVKTLDIQYNGKQVDISNYEIQLPDYNAFSEVYSKLYRNDLVVLDPDSKVYVNKADILYTYIEPSNSYDIHMEGDLENDVYTITFTKV